MSNSRRLKTYFGIIFVIVCVLVLPWNKVAKAAEDGQYKMIDGLAVYLGVVPAEIVKGHPSGHDETTMHGGPSKGRHEYHVVAAIFDAATGARVSSATVTAQISGLGLSGTTKKLASMEIANTASYGGFFDLPGADFYTIRLTIQRPDRPQAVAVEFKYDHRRQ
jgi:hypothetical protein